MKGPSNQCVIADLILIGLELRVESVQFVMPLIFHTNAKASHAVIKLYNLVVIVAVHV